MTLTDLRAVAEAARAAGAISVADNTFATPLNQQPLSVRNRRRRPQRDQYLGGTTT